MLMSGTSGNLNRRNCVFTALVRLEPVAGVITQSFNEVSNVELCFRCCYRIDAHRWFGARTDGAVDAWATAIRTVRLRAGDDAGTYRDFTTGSRKQSDESHGSQHRWRKGG